MKKLNLTLADLNRWSKGDKESMYLACEAFAKNGGFQLFFEHLRNLYISSTLGFNKGLREAGATLITDEYFNGGLDVLEYVEKTIIEMSQSRNLNIPTLPPKKS